MIITLEWNILNLSEWEARFYKISRSSLLQSYTYAQAIAPLHGQRPRWGLIKVDGKEAGLVQILEAGLFNNALHAVLLDRGPLWFDGFGCAAHFAGFADEYKKQFPRRLGRKHRFIPEIEYSNAIKILLDERGFRKQRSSNYQTIWVDLRPDEAEIFTGLKSRARNSIRKAEKAALTIEWDILGQHFDWLMMQYADDKKNKNYDGPRVSLLSALAARFIPAGDFLIGRVLMNHKPIGAILVLCHGSSATYQIGWTSDLGRKNAAHPFLLWSAYLYLKQRNIQFFDLGGVNDDSAKAVKKFKQSMGGQLVTLPGLYS